MKKPAVISLVILALIFAAVAFVLVSKKADAPAADETRSSSSQTQSSEPGQTAEPEQNVSNSGVYTEYDEAKLASSKGRDYLFFHAPWCPQCRAIESSINAGGNIPSGVTIFKVDYDTSQDLRKKYGVTQQTTFVSVDNQGNFIDKYVAYDNPSIDSVVENFINK